MKVKVAKWGNGLGVRLPKAAADAVGAIDGGDLELTVQGRSLTLVPESNSRLRLQALLDQIDPENVPPMVQWGPDVGSEIIDDDYSRGLIVPGPDGTPSSIDRDKRNQASDKRDARSRRR